MATQNKSNQTRSNRRPLSDMQKKRRDTLRRRIRNIIIGVLLAALIGGALFFLLNRDESRVSVVENGIGSILSMVQSGVTTVVDEVSETVENIANYDDFKAEYDALERENDALTIRLKESEQALVENERLQGLLDAKNEYDSLDPIYARVIARTPGPWFDTFSVNRGDLNGVTVGMSVITADGLVGRVYEVGLNYAKVLSVVDPRSAVAMLVERTRDNGIMRGVVTSASEVAECYVYYLPNVNSVIPGDTVITSGMDTIYPKGIPIGVVTEVSREVDSANQYVVVQPYVDFAHIEDVLILREVVETDKGQLPAVPTPTPVPEITFTPSPTDENGKVIGADKQENENFVRVTIPPELDWSIPETTIEPLQTIAPVDMSLPEDAWANE